MKQVIIMRTDLKMGKGKIAAQACHAAVSCYKMSNKDDISKWESSGAKKVVLKIQTEQELLELNTLAKAEGLVSSIITDAGHTQIKPCTRTCLGIGPADDEVIDKLTGHLKLL